MHQQLLTRQYLHSAWFLDGRTSMLVLTLIYIDLTLVEVYTVALDYGSDTYQIKIQIVQVNTDNPQKMSYVQLLFHALYCMYVFCDVTVNTVNL